MDALHRDRARVAVGSRGFARVAVGVMATLLSLTLFILSVRSLLAAGQAFCPAGVGGCGVEPWWTQIDQWAGVLLTGLLLAATTIFTVRAIRVLRRSSADL